MKSQILFLIFLSSLLAACGQSSPSKVALNLAPVVDTEPVEPPAQEPEPELGTILDNWGYIESAMPLKFDALQFGVEKRRLYYHDSDGMVRQVTSLAEHRGEPGVHEVRACVDYITITGTETQGTITIARNEIGWTMYTAEYGDPANPCVVNAGVYNYRITEEGMWFGRAGSEVLYE